MKGKLTDAINRHDESAQLWINDDIHPGAVIWISLVEMRGLQINRKHFPAHEIALEACCAAPSDAKFMANETSGAVCAD